MIARITLILAGSVLVASASRSAIICEFDPRVADAAEAWIATREQPPLVVEPARATCFRDALLAQLAGRLGPVLGYKAGVYTPAARAIYGTNRPVVGVLRRHMILKDGSSVSPRFGFAPLAEADLLLVVRDGGINTARTREDAYRHLRGYRPFIELPDNHYGPTAKPDLARLVALNVGARLGVMGAEVPLPRTAAGLSALTGLEAIATITTAAGGRVARARIVETLGDPLEIVLAARDALWREGKSLKAGDLISLGTLIPAHTPEGGETFRVDYRVASHRSQVVVTFMGE